MDIDVQPMTAMSMHVAAVIVFQCEPAPSSTPSRELLTGDIDHITEQTTRSTMLMPPARLNVTGSHPASPL